MSNWGRRPITDAGKAKSKPPHIAYYFDGEERIDRRPLGRVERFVDPQGNVCSLKLADDGDAQRLMTADRLRMQYRRDGFVEHAKCPLRHGTNLMAGTIAKDFSKMPASLGSPCDADPRTLLRQGHELHATEACPHVEWLINSRREHEKVQAEKRNATRIAQERREAAKQKMEDLQFRKAQAEMEELGMIEPEDVAPPTKRRRKAAAVEEPSE